jgi:hypothetical protein
MSKGFLDSPFARGLNRFAVALMDAPLLGGLVRRGMVVIRYTGRKSGKSFELPVGYRRTGEGIVIGVSMPDKKSWWRNFLGDGGPITFVGLDGSDRTGHAIATRDADGGVKVSVKLD